jgi:heme-degrading monooxygenase HmoA
MILVTLRARARSAEDAREACRLGYVVFEGYREPGFLAVRCAVGDADPRDVLVHLEWGSRAAYAAWDGSAWRTDLRRQLAPLFEGDWQTEVHVEV